MRLKCEYKADKIPIAKNMLFVSLIKEAINTANTEYYKKLYCYGEKGNKQIKSFSFSTYLKDFNIQKDIVYINDRVILNITTTDYEFGINLYNGLLKIKKFNYKDFSLQMIKISLSKEKFISGSTTIFKTLSPICIKDEKNNFLSPKDDNFTKELNYIVNNNMESNRGYGLRKPIKFEEVSMKKVVVKEQIRGFTEETQKSIFYVNAYHGMFRLCGDVEDLNYIYRSGLGFRRSQGFGMLDIV